jgi:hypothetical protein
MIVFVTCAVFTLGAFLYVFYLPAKIYTGPRKTRVAYLRERKEAVYENLRDLNFEFKAGKVPEGDYGSMKASLEEEAAAIMSEIAHLEQSAASSSLRGSKGART